MFQTILFDLDGTLLPMDQEIFTQDYFRRLAAKLAPRGYDAKKLIDAIWAGTAAMVKNDGSCTNEEAFWRTFSQLMGPQVLEDKPLFEEYYRVEFQQVAKVCGCNPKAKETIERLKRKGYRLALATNPLFPLVGVESRMAWAGLNPADQVCYLAAEKRPVLVLAENMLKELSASGPIVWRQRRWVRLDGSGIVASEG